MENKELTEKVVDAIEMWHCAMESCELPTPNDKLAQKIIPIIQKAERERITDLMFENGFSTLVYFHPGEGHRDWADRWVAGILTGRDNDLICVRKCKTTQEAEKWLSPSASDIVSALEKAVALKEGGKEAE